MTSTLKALIAASLIVVAVATGVVSGTLATFTAQTVNPGNVESNATLAMKNVAGTAVAGSNCSTETTNGTCATLFNVQNLLPGGSSSNTATITYTGSVPTGDFRLFMANFNEFASGYNTTLCTNTHPGQQIGLQIKQGSAVIYPTSGTGFGSLYDFAVTTAYTSSSTGLRLKPGANSDSGTLGTWPAANPPVVFTVNLQMDSAVDNTNQGCRSSFDLDWYATQNSPTLALLSTLSTGALPYGLAYSQATNRLYVANYGANAVQVYNATTYALLATIAIASPSAIALNAATNRLYVAQNGVGIIGVIDTSTNTVLSPVAGAVSSIGGLAVDSTTNMIYNVNSEGPPRLEVINGATNSVTATIGIAIKATQPALNSVTHRLYVPNWNDNNLTVFDTTTNAVVTTITGLVGMPQFAVVDTSSNLVYVSTNGSNSVWVINGATNAIVTTIPFGPFATSSSDPAWATVAPNALAINSATHRLYVALQAGKLAVVDTTTNIEIARVNAGGQPTWIALVGDGLAATFNADAKLRIFGQ